MNKLILLMSLFSSNIVFGEPIETNLQVQGYDLQLRIFAKGERVVIPTTGVFLDEFDFNLVRQTILNFKETLVTDVENAKSERDALCNTEKESLTKRFKEQVSLCETSLNKKDLEIQSLQDALNAQKNAHKKELRQLYLIGGVSAATLLGVITLLIVN